MTSAQDLALERLQLSVTDRRADNGRYRQNQLQNLHKSLREDAGSIVSALLTDTKSSTAEAETQYYLAMEVVRHFYDSIHFDEELEKEYSIVHGKNNEERQLGAGLVIIRPTSHTRFYSIIAPLAAAIAAGNCVILELSDTILQVDSVLRSLLLKALDLNTFAIFKTITDKSILGSAILVDQTSDGPATTLTNQLFSSSRARTVAVVDRTANIEEAAKAIAKARFSFGGTSPYAPDLVLVNEYAKKEFFEACSKYATLSFAKESTIKKTSGNQNEDTRKAVQEAEDRRQISSFGSNDFKLVDILDKSTPLMKLKISGRYLPIATCSGLVDAVFGQDFENPLLAGYFFAEPESAKYLAQHIPCHVSSINQIPIQLLVGPAAPTAHKPDFYYRYSREMFTFPRPQFVEPPQDTFKKAEELLAGSKAVSTSSLRSLAVKPLKPTGQPKNEIIGFFESGFLLGASITLTVVLPVLGWTSYVVGRKGLEYASRLRR